MTNQFGVNPQFNQFNLGEVKGLVTQNELNAYDLTTGKLRWDLNAGRCTIQGQPFPEPADRRRRQAVRAQRKAARFGQRWRR